MNGIADAIGCRPNIREISQHLLFISFIYSFIIYFFYLQFIFPSKTNNLHPSTLSIIIFWKLKYHYGSKF